MRSFFVLLLLLTLPLVAFPQNERESEDQDHEEFNKNYLQFFKKIKSVKVFEKSNVDSPKRSLDEIDFKIVESKNIDNRGRLSSIMYYTYNPDSQHRYFFQYDSSSLKSCQKINLENEVVFQWNFNKDTLVTEEIKFSNGTPRFSWKYTYDEAMNLVDVAKVKSSGKITWRVVRKYDSLDRLISYQSMKGNGKVKYHGQFTYRDTTEQFLSYVHMKKNKILEMEKYKYDSTGLLREKENYGKRGYFEVKTKFEYDSLDRKIKTSVLDINLIPNLVMEYEYDNNDRVTKETLKNGVGAIMQKVEYEYDGFDHVKFKRVFNNHYYSTSEVLIYNDYDSDGNLIEERMESLDTNHKLVRKHEYQYYNDDEIVLE